MTNADGTDHTITAFHEAGHAVNDSHRAEAS
jgi:hypothetical protein